MMQQGLRHFSDIPLTVFGMMVFFTTFLAVVIKLSRTRASDWNNIAKLPLEGDSHE